METTGQPTEIQIAQTNQELGLEIIDLPDMSETASCRHAWLWQKVLQWQRSIHPRSRRFIQAFSTLLLALVATLVILGSIRSSVTSSPIITSHPIMPSASSNPITYDQNPLTIYR